MAKAAPDATLDTMLTYIATSDTMYVCSAQPTTYAEASSTYALADVAMTPGDGNDYTIGNGDSSGRKVAMAQKADIDIDTSGDATHIALTEGGDTLMYVTTCTTQTLSDTGTVTVPTWDIEIADPT